MSLQIQSVSELTRSLKDLLEGNFRFVHIHGEVSNLKSPLSGHLYFTLKDSHAQLKAVLFKGQQRYLGEAIQDGQQLVCHGRISVYEPRGEYQLVIDTVDFLGTGLLQIRFEKQKLRLAAEGLFDPEHKKNLPSFPREIVVITSPTGAAIYDFLTICKRRMTSARILIFPVRVQGEGAASEIAAAIDRVNGETDADVIVLCRGGGSLEDLWAFNEDVVARSIYNSRIPVLTGIGHEIDFSIADFCADFRAPTPTGAAEVIIPDNIALQESLQILERRLCSIIERRLATEENRIAANRRFLGDLGSLFINHTLRLDACLTALIQSIRDRLAKFDSSCLELTRRLQRRAPVVTIDLQQQRLENLKGLLTHQMESLFERKKTAFLQQAAKLESMSPLATLARGYAIVSKEDIGTDVPDIVTDSKQVEIHDRLAIRLHRGRLHSAVIDKEEPEG